jgi:hypothetical protein
MLASLAGESWSMLQGSRNLMIRQRINEVVEMRFMIELNMKFGNDTMQENIDPEAIGEVFDPRCAFPDVLGGLNYSTHLFIIEISAILI